MSSPRPPRIRTAEFRSLFHMIVRATLASSCAAACSAETQQGEVGDAGASPNRDADVATDGGSEKYDYLACGTLALPKLPAPLQTTPSATAVVIYRSTYYLDHVDNNQLRAVFGPALCNTSDQACAEALTDTLRAAPCSDEPNACPSLALHKQGDTLTRLQTREELLSFFGEIDSVAKAVLLAAFDGRTLHCARPSDQVNAGPWKGTGVYEDDDGFHIESEYELCWDGAKRERYTIAKDGTLREESAEILTSASCAIGRRPEGMCGAHPAPQRSDTAGFLAEVAELEAASVLAFRKIADELQALDAPSHLVAASHSALSDEVRHADVMARMARRFGGTPQPPEVPESSLRSAYALARDNASEGCVRETFGALLASYQAQRAEDVTLRAAFQTIAADETRHAQLSWEIAAWLEPQLSIQEREEIARVRMVAVETLSHELDLGLSEEALRELGLPAPAEAAKLFHSLRETLWS